MLPFSRDLEVFVVSGPLKNCSGKNTNKHALVPTYLYICCERRMNEATLVVIYDSEMSKIHESLTRERVRKENV